MAEQTAAAQDKKASKSKTNQHTQRHGCPFTKWAMIGCVVLSLIAIALSAIVWVRSNQMNTQAQAGISQQLQIQGQHIANQLAQTRNRLKTLSLRVSENASLTESQRRLNAADYFVRLANLNLSFNQNPITATKLLKRADYQLQQANNPALNSVRQAVLSNISALRDQRHIDVTATLLQLNQLVDRVLTLKIIPTKLPNSSGNRTANSEKKGWKHGLDQAWQQIRSLVVIRHQDQGAEPLLSPKQFQTMKLNIAWQLMQAQWAVLHQSNTLYQQSLHNAIKWLTQYQNHNQADASALITQLQHLSSQNAAPNYPSLLKTLQLIQTTKQQITQPESAKNAAATPLLTLTPSTPKKADNNTSPSKSTTEKAPSIKKLLQKTNKSVEI